ncbi:ecdysteroid 22-kinase family protein [Shewanella eurypsychrophilus]|uniref:Ecdysteroid 22-kinase family protein n=1 Tax=Shewanella eurypsychrophilus TaxID=2593656 RepID=A0ABX6V654_9GAMM|nr:phosphotransferase [Shewanella sp. YLB-09]QPG58118.1 ecdysteroid 22-kinase family protein [Shewanella eurypsychrophilus]
MSLNTEQFLLHALNATHVSPIETIQELWSGYGKIERYHVEGDTSPSRVIVKSIRPPEAVEQIAHPRGWNTSASHQRKLFSYQVESNWYQYWNSSCDTSVRVPECYGVMCGTDIFIAKKDELTEQLNNDQHSVPFPQNEASYINKQDHNEQNSTILMSDLDSQGFAKRHQSLSLTQARICIQWLANFHATFMQDSPDSDWPKGLWPVGSYWHLNTREDEYQNMPESALKQAAHHLDHLLNHTRFKTIIHGDAKVANFCFSEDDTDVAAVDFQYVGAGCGMRDLVYFIGSCLSDVECEQHHQQLTKYYFSELTTALLSKKININPIEVEREWTGLFVIAWADFQRFILGWSPNHHKNNQFSRWVTKQAISDLK